MAKEYIFATGRRKTSVARVRLIDGTGKITVNKKDASEYFARPHNLVVIKQPLKTCDAETKYDVFINVHGGGTTGQAGAIKHGIARALVKADETNRGALKRSKMLTRDPRMVERKKYGQRGARRRFQFSKR